jgi:hypothetical protein
VVRWQRTTADALEQYFGEVRVVETAMHLDSHRRPAALISRSNLPSPATMADQHAESVCPGAGSARFELEGLAPCSIASSTLALAGGRRRQRHDDQLEDAVGQRLAGFRQAVRRGRAADFDKAAPARCAQSSAVGGVSFSVIPISPNTPEGASCGGTTSLTTVTCTPGMMRAMLFSSTEKRETSVSVQGQNKLRNRRAGLHSLSHWPRLHGRRRDLTTLQHWLLCMSTHVST